jgi:hypothetical protein
VKVKALADTSDLRDRMKMWSDLVGKEMGEGLRQHARVACVNLANTTQPYSGKGQDGTSQSGGGRALGEKAVEVDISKVFYTPEPGGGFVRAMTEMAEKSFRYRAQKSKGKFNAEKARSSFLARLETYVASNNRKALRKLVKDFNWMGVIDNVDPALHQAARSGPRKKVSKRRGQMYLVLGGRRGAIATYTNKIKKRVGLTKAGWAVCAAAIPLQRVSSATRGIPQWVTRNMKNAGDSYINDKSNDRKNPRVTMTNAAPWASQNITPNETRKALDMARNKFVKYMNTQINYELKRKAGLK